MKTYLEAFWSEGGCRNPCHLTGWALDHNSTMPLFSKGRLVSAPASRETSKRLKNARKAFADYRAGKYVPVTHFER